MNLEIGAEAALFPEKEHISGISVAVSAVMYGSSSTQWWAKLLRSLTVNSLSYFVKKIY